jgi:hypothetical protein
MPNPKPRAPKGAEVDCAAALTLAHNNLSSPDPARRQAAETIVSYLGYVLKYPQVALPPAVAERVRLLMQAPL